MDMKRHDLQVTRRQVLKGGAALGGAFAVAPILAACGSSTQTNAPTSGASASAATPLPSASTAAASASPKAGGTLKFGVVGDIRNFDPYQNLTLNFPILQNLNAFLINYTDQLEPVPAAVQSWDIASDHKSVTLHLRSDITFQTGKPFTAADLVFGFQRAADSSEGGNLYGPMSVVADSTAQDAHTVVLNFNSPVPELLITDLLESFPIVDQSDNNSKYLATAPASAGPFKLGSYTPNTSIVLDRFGQYWDQPLPYLDGATIEVFDNNDTLVSGLQSGSIDGAMRVTALNAKTLGGSFNIVRGYPGALVNILRLNPNTPPFDNLYLRQAIQRAVDRERIVNDVFFGYSQPLVLPWGPNSPAYDKSYDTKYAFDLDAAKQLWQQAGSPSTGEAIAEGTNTESLQILQIIQSDLQKIGFNLKITTQDPQTWIQNVIAGDFGALIGAIGNSSKSPSRIDTNSLFRIESNPVWKDKLPQDYVDAIKASETAVTQDQAQAAYAQLNQVITHYAWGIGIGVLLSLFAVRKGVVGFTRDVDDRVVLQNTWIQS